MPDSEIAKLRALYLEPGGSIDESLVREIVTGWQGKTVWEINDAIAAGNASDALKHLDKLMSGGQPPDSITTTDSMVAQAFRNGLGSYSP